MILLITKRNLKKSNDYVNFKKHRKKKKENEKISEVRIMHPLICLNML